MTQEYFSSDEDAAAVSKASASETSDSSSDSDAEDVELQGCEDAEFAELSAAKRAFALPNIAQRGKQLILNQHNVLRFLMFTKSNVFGLLCVCSRHRARSHWHRRHWWHSVEV
jgi:hypothetical protein